MATITYPYRSFRYQVTIDGMTRAGFSEVTGMNLSTQVVEYREGNDLRNTPRKLPGLTTFGNVTFRWGTTTDSDFLTWIQSVAPNNTANPTGIARKNITIALINDAGTAGPTWTLINAWPVSYSGPELNGMGNDVAISSLEVCCEGMWLTTPGSEAGTPSTI